MLWRFRVTSTLVLYHPGWEQLIYYIIITNKFVQISYFLLLGNTNKNKFYNSFSTFKKTKHNNKILGIEKQNQNHVI